MLLLRLVSGRRRPFRGVWDRVEQLATLLALCSTGAYPEPRSIDPPDVFYLLDSSTSMVMGTSVSRWDEVAVIAVAAKW